MSYPENTLLTKPVRRTILVFLILTFFIISPIIIFYTAGYRYDFERHKIQQTGVLSINAKPRDAVVTINGVVIDNGKRLPLRLSNRAPGTYWVTLNKDGYYPWEKSIVIRSNETTYIRDVTLIKKSQPGTLPLDISSSKEVVASEDGRYLAILSENNSVYTVVLYDIREKVEHPLFSEQLKTAPSLSWSPYHPFLLIHTATNSGAKVEVVDARNPEQRKINQTFSNSPISPVQWTRISNTPTIYIQASNTIYRIAGGSQHTISPVQSSVWHVDDDGNLWWYDTKEKRLWYNSEDNLPLSIVIETPLTDILDINNRRLIASTNDSIIHLAFNNDRTHTLSNIPTTNTYYDSTLNEWYAWSENELWGLYADGTYLILNRSSEPIESVRTLDQTGLLLFSTSEQLMTFHPGYTSVQTILSDLSHVRDLAVDQERKYIIVTGTVKGVNGIHILPY